MTLPVHAPSLPALSLVRRAAESYGVEVQALGTIDQAPTASALGRLSIEASLRGRYGPIKQVLAEVLSQSRGRVLVQSLTLHRPGNGPELEARVVLAWPTRPGAAPAMPSDLRMPRP